MFLFVGWALPGVLFVCARRVGLSWVWMFAARAVSQRLLVVLRLSVLPEPDSSLALLTGSELVLSG